MITIGLGIGACTAIFSVCDAILWKPVPLPNLETLAGVIQQEEQTEWDSVTPADLAEKVFRSLTQPRTLDEISGCLPGYRIESLREQLETLVREGVLTAVLDEDSVDNPTFAALLDELGFGARETLAKLAKCRVAVSQSNSHSRWCIPASAMLLPCRAHQRPMVPRVSRVSRTVSP